MKNRLLNRLVRCLAGVPLCAVFACSFTTTAKAQAGRNPELRSRALAWTEFDGSYLVDTNSRAEMLDFYWTVFARPYPLVNWTGSTSPAVAGQTSEAWRARCISQINAYRALNYSAAITEDPSRNDFVQAGALVLALNPDRGLSHTIDSTWLGYNTIAAQALGSCLLGGFGENLREDPIEGLIDGFIQDGGTQNLVAGHRGAILSEGIVRATIGAAFASWNGGVNTSHFATLNLQGRDESPSVQPERFVAWPAPGFMPLGFFRGNGWTPFYRWSFSPRLGATVDFTNVTVTARVDGRSITARNILAPGGGVTWEFSPSEFSFDTAPGGTSVEITVGNVRAPQTGRTHEYHYTVRLFDEFTMATSGFAPLSPLVNISTRGTIGGGDAVMIAGFSVSGDVPVRVALRTQGPGLARFGLNNTAKETRLQIFDAAQNKLGENAGWRQHQDWRLLQALNVAPSDDNEAGMVLTLWPGNYTAVVSDDAGANGVGLVEAFNIDNLTAAKLGNLSTRGLVGADDATALIAGITLKERRTVVIRTQGPALTRFGVGNAVADTVLKIVAQSDGRTIADNDDWQSDPANARLKSDLAAFAPSDAREAALVLTLPAGAYTAIVSAKGAPGVGIVEVFDVN